MSKFNYNNSHNIISVIKTTILYMYLQEAHAIINKLRLITNTIYIIENNILQKSRVSFNFFV